MTTDDLIDTMANLHFKHQRIVNQKSINLDKRMLPILLVKGEEHYLIIKMDDSVALVFDGSKGRFVKKTLTKLKGDIYSFKYVGELSDSLMHKQNNWFTKLILRFTKSFKLMTFLTMIMTFLDLLIPLFIILIYGQIGSNDNLPVLIFGVVLYFTSSMILEYLRAVITNYISVRMGTVISQQTFRQLLYLTPSYTETASVSSQVSRIKDFENLKRFTNSGIFINILELGFSIIYIAAMFFMGGWIGVVPIVTFIIVSILGVAMRPFHKVKMEQSSIARSERQGNLLEILKNSEEIKVSGMKDHWINRTKEFSGKSIFKNYNQSNFVSASNNLIYFITNASVMVVIYGGVLRVFDGKLSMGGLIGIILLYWKVLASIRATTSLFVQVSGLTKSINQINRFMKLPQDTNLKSNMVLTKDIKGQILFKDVSIRYNKTSKAALVNVNFKVGNGEILGIRGHDGSGKTTILKLILGMYLPQGGRIIIDNNNIKQLEPLTLRQSVSYSPERDMVFLGSIRSNFKNVNPSITDKQIDGIIHETNLIKYFKWFNYNLDTVIDEKMMSEMSPSFKKILCLSRLLARDVNIYLIDEPENHLDKEELTRVIEIIHELSNRNKTVVVVSKNESVLSCCDNVITLNQGRLV